MTAQLSTPTLLRLIEYLRTRSGSNGVSEALNTALEFWLDAWFDLSVRRPGDKQFKMASVLRKELAGQKGKRDQEQLPMPAAPNPTAIDTAATSLPRDAVQKSDFDPGWDLPERRKFRYRMEDIAY